MIRIQSKIILNLKWNKWRKKSLMKSLWNYKEGLLLLLVKVLIALLKKYSKERKIWGILRLSSKIN